MRFYINDGSEFEMNYEIINNVLPRTTLFIHGNLSSNRWWYPSAEIWKNQTKNNNLSGDIILAEFRGHGLSTSPKSHTEINVVTFANDFLKLITSLELDKINVVGHSAGGIVAATMLLQNSSLFNKAILLDPIGAKGFKLDNLRMLAHEAMKFNKYLTANAIGSVIYNNNCDDTFFNEIIVEDAFKAVKNVGNSVFQSVYDFDISSELYNVENDVLILHGEKDTFLPIKDSKELSEFFKNGQFMSIPNHGHSLNLENPDLFVSICNKFLF